MTEMLDAAHPRLLRVAFVNNMNNAFFAMARYFRLLGIEAHLYHMTSAPPNFAPQCDTFEDVRNLHWVRYCPFNESPKEFLLTRNLSLNAFRKYDVIIGMGTAPAFFMRSGIPMDIIIPYGADLYAYTNPPWCWSAPLVSTAEHYQALWLRKAYRHAKYVINNDFVHPLYREALDRLGISSLRLAPPVVFNMETGGEEHWTDLAKHDFVVFHHCRHLWATNPDSLQDYDKHGGEKRNDRLIRAFAQFVQTTRFRAPLLVMFEYGPDVGASQQLVEECGITAMVRWAPISSRKVIMQGLTKAHLATNQFREGVCGFGCTALEALACGTPLLTHADGALENPRGFLKNAPVIDVLHTEEICNVFMDYERSPEKYREIGRRSREWFDKNLGINAAQHYVALCQDIAKRKRAVGKEANR